MFELGVEMLPYGSYPFAVAVQELASMGFKAVNLWSAKPPLANFVNPGDNPKEIRSMLAGYGMRPSALSLYCWTQEEMKRRIEFASELGADTVIFHCDMELEDLKNSFLPPLLDAATKRGIKIAIENHVPIKSSDPNSRWQRAAETLDDIKRLVVEINHPNVGIALAPPHLWVVNESISETILYLAERKKLFFYYIWDINPNFRQDVGGLNFWESPGNTQVPRPDGTLDHRALLRLLKMVGYEGVVSLKSHGFVGWPLEKITPQLRTSAEYVRKCLADA